MRAVTVKRFAVPEIETPARESRVREIRERRRALPSGVISEPEVIRETHETTRTGSLFVSFPCDFTDRSGDPDAGFGNYHRQMSSRSIGVKGGRTPEIRRDVTQQGVVWDGTLEPERRRVKVMRANPGAVF